MDDNSSDPVIESGYMMSVAQRAADYIPIERKNQLSKVCWFASEKKE